MLTFFPKPYPDELLYSIVARYHVWSGNEEMSDTMEQLYGYRRERATLFIPKHLKRLAERTKEFGLNYETLLYEHTIFPFITCFLSKTSYDYLLNSINNDDKEISLFMYKHNIYPRFLRYCPHCIIDDRDEYGESYWHRRHQSYGVDICCKHRCHLMDSSIEVSDNRNNRYIALELTDDIKETVKDEDLSEC
ncbi:MAG: TniQ family protein, partial [Mobilitalea sp.]